MPHVATWIREKDDKWFRRAFAKHPNVRLWNARTQEVPLEKMNGLLLSGGPDVAPEFLHQPVPDPSILDTDMEPERARVTKMPRRYAASRRAAERSPPAASRPLGSFSARSIGGKGSAGSSHVST